jgi:hypothetical protein
MSYFDLSSWKLLLSVELVSTKRNVGLVGFEPTASWSRTRRSTKLSHSPKMD